MKFLDGGTPMALERPDPQTPPQEKTPKPPAKRRAKLTEAEKAERAEARRLEREAAKAGRAADRERAKADAKLAKIAEAEGGLVQLPAIVLRDGTVRHVSDTDAWAVIAMYLGALCVDCETSGYPLGHELYELRTVQLGGEEAAVVFDASDSSQMAIASLGLELASKLHAHSAIADLVPCVAAGLTDWDAAWAKMHDSVLYAKLVDPKLAGSDENELKKLSADLLREYAVSPQAEIAKNALFAAMGCKTKTTLTDPPDKNGWYCVNHNSVVMTRYAGSDVLDLAAVLRVLPPLPVEQSVLDSEREFEAACAPVTWAGFALDSDHIKKKITEEEAAKAEALHIVQVLSDGKIVNPKSPDVIKLLPEFLDGVSLGVNRKTKRLSADKGSLEGVSRKLAPDSLAYFLCKNILAYRHHDTTLSLLLRQLERLCDYGDSRMRPTVYTIEATTGRTSCRRPNGQQFSRQGGIRACVKAGDMYIALIDGQWMYMNGAGERMDLMGISADFAGCEIRVAAALSGDRGLYEAEISPFCWKCETDSVTGAECTCGYDDKGELAAHQGLHWRTAHSAFGKSATKEHRYQAKRGTFTKLFGGEFDTAAAQVFCDPEVMRKLFWAFDSNAPQYAVWDGELRTAYKRGSFLWRDYETGQNHSVPIEGRNRMVYRAYSGRNIYIGNGEHAAGNGAIQGTARELLKDGTLAWRRTRWGKLPLLPVHDQILSFVPVHEAREATAVLAQCMRTSVLSSPGFEVLITADVDEPFASWPDSS